MKIERIEATNFLGLRHCAVDVPGVLLVAGPNACGKSSLIEAVRFALTGETPRVRLKKHFPDLVSSGAKDGSVAVVVDGRTVVRNVRSGNCASATPDVPDALPYVLDAQRLAALDATERRRFLFGLVGVSVSPDGVAEELRHRGHAPEHVERIKPLLRSGFDAAAQEAGRLASEARGGWKAVTGEAYGAKKAEAWAPAPAVAPHTERPDLDQARKAHEAAVRAAAQLAARRGAAQQAEGQRASLAQRAGRVAEFSGQVHRLETEARATGPAPRGGPVLPCPECGAPLTLHEGRLVARPPAAANAVRPARDVEADLARAREALRDAEQAQAALNEIAERDVPPPPDDAEIARAEEAAKAAAEALAEAVRRNQAWQEAERGAREEVTRRDRAHELHREVLAWAALEAALSPSGLPAELLARACGPFNDRLQATHAATGWPLVQLGPDLEITAGGRPYGLLSESERWRTDAALAEAVAKVSGLGLLVLDRLDVLDVPGRGVLVRWLSGLRGEYDTILAAGTLKAPPAALPPGVSAVWLGTRDGVGRAAA